ncbi:hypothetical protein Taro_033921, partial [Colocasia esculenta]|nr:hypothetical protein [Colocasia esculenta]
MFVPCHNSHPPPIPSSAHRRCDCRQIATRRAMGDAVGEQQWCTAAGGRAWRASSKDITKKKWWQVGRRGYTAAREILVTSQVARVRKKDVDNISIQGNDEMQTHGHIDDNLHTQHYEYQQLTGLFTRMLNDDADSTRFYSGNERDVRHHVTEEHVIEEDEEEEIDSHDDIDDNGNMDEGDDEPLFDIVMVNNTEIEYEQDPPDIFTSDQWIDEAMLNNSHEGTEVPCTLEGGEPHVGQVFKNKKNFIY